MTSLLNLVQRARGARVNFDITSLSDVELLRLMVYAADLTVAREQPGTERDREADRAAMARAWAVEMASISGRSPPLDLEKAAELLYGTEMTDFATDQLRAVATHPAFAEMQREPDDGTLSGLSGKLTPRMKRKIELAIEAGSASPIEMVPG